MNILVIGSLNMDLVISIDSVPKMGETIFGRDFTTVCGGKGANQAVAAARLGSVVKMIGSVGDDIFGKKLLDNLAIQGIGADGVETVSGPSGIAVITVCGGNNCIILEKGANLKTDCSSVEKHVELLEWADAVIFQFEVPYETVLYAAKKAKALGKTVIVNPAPIRDIDEELLGYIDILVPNEHEAMGLLGYEIDRKSCERAVKELLAKGISQVIITMGKEGCVYNDGNEIKRFGIYETEVVDTTAAGDSFIAGICTALGEGKDINDAVKFATAVSAIVVSRYGAGTSIPSREEVDEFLCKIEKDR
ncbi:MAG: ribokinase [Ruminococcaceae bacterium]|nr:ribokinase [Oscillospiraceae bacterium]